MVLTADSRLVLIDLQSRLLAAIPDAPDVVARAGALVRAADILGVPVCATEQNPDGIGPTVPELAALVPLRFGKSSFSAVGAPAFRDWAEAGGTILVAGTEAHVCVLQTVLELAERGLRVACVADAMASRHRANHRAALARMAAHGVAVVTTEMVLFEWLGRYDRPEFKQVLPLIKGLPAPDQW